jgi:hypothetical protein
MRRILAVGGRQKRDAIGQDESKHYECAVMAEVDCETGAVKLLHEYRSPPQVIPSRAPSIVFKSATQLGNTLYACTQTEVLIYKLPEAEIVGSISLPRFNDVHHVRPRADGSLLVVSTGLDCVLHLDSEGRLIREWPVLPPDLQKKFDPALDYRRVSTTKPHASHPNFVFELAGQIWVTRFEQRDAVCIEDMTQRIPIGIERPHDGTEFAGELYFTTVDGHLVMVDVRSRQVSRLYDLAAFSDRDLPLGWCRGIHVLSQADVLVGFSRLRPMRWVDNLRWMVHRLRGNETRSLPTRIARYDLARGACIAEWDLESVGMNTIFSIHPQDS